MSQALPIQAVLVPRSWLSPTSPNAPEPVRLALAQDALARLQGRDAVDVTVLENAPERPLQSLAEHVTARLPTLLLADDVPFLAPDVLSEAVNALRGGVDVVVGPAWGKDAYLVGLGPQARGLQRVLEDTGFALRPLLDAAQQRGLTLHVLPSAWTMADRGALDRLHRQLATTPTFSPSYPRHTAQTVLRERPAEPTEPRNVHWTTLTSRLIYENKWVRFDENLVRIHSNDLTLYGMLVCKKALGVVPLNADGSVRLVRQFRYIAQRFTWEIPTGAAEEAETWEQAALRELREEAGVHANRLLVLPTVHTNKSILDEEARLYVGLDLTPAEGEADATEDITVHDVPWAEAMELIATGDIVDGLTLVGLLATDRMRLAATRTGPALL